LILKTVKVVCFSTDLEVFILKRFAIERIQMILRTKTLVPPKGATISKPCFSNMETVPCVDIFPKDGAWPRRRNSERRRSSQSMRGKASTTPPPFFLIDSRAARKAAVATPHLRCFLSTTKQVILQRRTEAPRDARAW